MVATTTFSFILAYLLPGGFEVDLGHLVQNVSETGHVLLPKNKDKSLN
jgi:hypothetical protein